MANQGQNPPSLDAKIVLLGDSAVGKTSIALRFVQDVWAPSSNPTIGASFLTKRVVVDGCKIKLQLWDTAGQERFRSLAPMYYRGALAALLVYDISNAQSFEEVKSWAEELHANIETELIIVVVGNKSDLSKHRAVPEKQGRTYALGINAMFTETSAKLNEGIEPLFIEICKRLVVMNNEKPQPNDEDVVKPDASGGITEDEGKCPC